MGKLTSKSRVSQHQDAATKLLAACSRYDGLDVKDVVLNLKDGSYVSAVDGLIEFEDEDVMDTSVLAESHAVPDSEATVTPAQENALCQNGFSMADEAEIMLPYTMPHEQVPGLIHALSVCGEQPSALDTILVLHTSRHFALFWQGVEKMLNMHEIATSPVFLSQSAVNLVYKAINLSAQAQMTCPESTVVMSIQFAGILGVAINALKDASLLPFEVAEAYAAIIVQWPEVETIVTATGSVLLEEHRKETKALAA